MGAAHINIAIAYYKLGDFTSSWRHSRIGEELDFEQAKILLRKLGEV